jgi:subtilisin family serine protease
VVVAHATTASFRDDVAKAAGDALASVGATRTVPVSEGTPEGVATAWGHGGSANLGGGTKTGHDDSTGTEATTGTTTDPREAEQWDMRMIKADQAHAITDGSRSVLVGVLDSGIDPDHPDLVANIDVADSVNCTDAGRPDTSPTGWWPTTSDHGTHVAGTIAAARNGTGIVGVAPNVRMASVKVVNDAGFIYPEYAVCGFMWAALHGMDVTNNSYYVDPFEFYCSDQPDQAAAKEAVNRAVQWSIDKGVVSAAAAGNSAYDLANKTTDGASPDDSPAVDRAINNDCQDIPTELDGVVTVASLEQFPSGSTESRLSSFSNRGLGVIDVAAPGSRILSTVVKDNGYGLKSGTSMASPHVAGVLALMKSAHPNWSPAKMLAALRAQADDKSCSAATAGAVCEGPAEDNSYFGEGVVDALDAVR